MYKLIGILVLAVDLLSKGLTHAYLPLARYGSYGKIPLFAHLFGGVDLSLVHVTNRGAAWGVLAEWQFLLLLLRIAFTYGLFFYIAKGNFPKEYRLPLTLILAGAVGNIVDWFIYGHVVDMIQFVFWGYQYPTFNVADSAICVGALLWVGYSLRRKKDRRHHESI